MSNSLRDQLLKAGLVSQERIKEAEQKQSKQGQKKNAVKHSKQQARKQPAKHNAKNAQSQHHGQKKQPLKTAQNDLAKFYAERKRVEKKEKADAQKKAREAAALRKKNRKRVRELITKHKFNDDKATIRYNFQIGTRIKFTFVTKDQQKQLAAGELAITFLDGERCIIPLSIIDEIRQLEPKKIIIINKLDAEDHDSSWDNLEWPEDANEDKSEQSSEHNKTEGGTG